MIKKEPCECRYVELKGIKPFWNYCKQAKRLRRYLNSKNFDERNQFDKHISKVKNYILNDENKSAFVLQYHEKGEIDERIHKPK
ncbi:MAG: hypothetical protein GY827_08460 [Cytophagales bacterium]|nr:hypothetical protein [Cytophagales bacterium]